MKTILSFAALLLSFGAFAQPVEKEQRVRALYVAYITQDLRLSEDEAQKFWPLHAQYDGEIKTVRFDVSELERQQATLNIKKKYQERFVKIIGASRTDDFFRKDAEFKKKLIEQLRNRKRPGMMNRNN